MNSSFKTCFLKVISFTVRVVIIIIVSQKAVQAQKGNFSGTWTLDREKTDFGKLSEKAVPVQFIVDQREDTIIIDRVTKNSQDELHSYIERLPFNGNRIENMTNLYTKKVASIHWGTDSQLTESALYTDYSDNVRYNGTEVWLLSNAGKILTITREDKADGSSYFRKMVYDRQ